jgi:hypothetical protein
MAKGTGKISTKSTPTHASKSRPKKNEGSKVGSDPSAAEHFADGGDFGIPAAKAERFPEVAEETKYQPAGDHHSDPRPARSGGQGTRESGVGGVASGPGSSSGGDLDTDLIGVGTHGIGISEAGPDGRKRGLDMTEAGSEPHAKHPHQPRKRMRGTTVVGVGGDDTATDGTGAGGVAPIETGEDAAVGEISQGEAAGDDNTDTDNLP